MHSLCGVAEWEVLLGAGAGAGEQLGGVLAVAAQQHQAGGGAPGAVVVPVDTETGQCSVMVMVTRRGRGTVAGPAGGTAATPPRPGRSRRWRRWPPRNPRHRPAAQTVEGRGVIAK